MSDGSGSGRGVVGRSSSDDPVDLGPFMQNYVMKNPFQQQQQQAAAAACQAAAAGDQYVTVMRRGPFGVMTRARSSATAGAAVKTRRRAGQHRGEASAHNGSTRRLPRVLSDALNDAADAANGSMDVSDWLRANYHCLSTRHRLLVAAQQLLLRVQQVFPHVTSDTIDDYVMSTFPSCVKTTNKRIGLSYYKGLVARPGPEVYDNPLLTAAVDSVSSRVLSTSQAAEKFGLRESSLLAAICWADVSPHGSSSSLRTSPPAGDSDRHSPTTSSSGQVVAASDWSPARAGEKRAHSSSSSDSTHEPPTQLRRVKHELNDCNDDDDDDDDDGVDFELMLQQDVQSSDDRSATSPLARRPVSPPSASDCRTPLPVVKSELRCSPDCRTDVAVSESPAAQPLNYSTSANARHNGFSEHSSGSGSTEQECRTSPFLCASRSSTSDWTGSKEVGRLQAELAAAQDVNLALQEELSNRDFHLAQLAEDFFSLHEQFKQLARHFQTVLGDVQRPVSVATTSRSNISVVTASQNHVAD